MDGNTATAFGFFAKKTFSLTLISKKEKSNGS